MMKLIQAIRQWFSPSQQPDEPTTMEDKADPAPPIAPPSLSANTDGGMVNTGTIHAGGDVTGRDSYTTYTTNHLPKPESSVATAPSPPTDFVGRTAELDQLTDLLINGHSAAITALQGMGGIGKTALAQQLAAHLNAHFSGGIFWASLYSGSGETILREWAAYCGVTLPQELTPNELQGQVRGALTMRQQKEGRLLAVLDDVRPASEATAHLLRQSLPAGTPLLITTRERRLADALQAEVIPLELLPITDGATLLANIIKKPALLQDETLVNQLLGRLGHLPLAIHLAATYIRNFSTKPGFTLAQFVDQLEVQALKPLETQGAERGLIDTFAISYDALTPQQQHLFGLASIYSPPLLTLDNIAGLLGPEHDLDSETLEDELDWLVNMALLDWHEETSGRYILHPLLGQYAYGRLQEAVDDVRMIHAQAAQLFLDRLADDGATPEEGLEEVDQWEKAGMWNKMAHRANALVGTLDRLGYWPEIDQRLATALDRLKRMDDSETVELQSNLILNRGSMAYRQAEWEKAIGFYEQSLQIYEELGSIYGIATSWMNQGNVYQGKGEWKKAIEYYEKSMKLYEQLGNISSIGGITNNIGLIYKAKGEWDKAIDYYELSLQAYKQVDNIYLIASVINNIGLVYQAKEEWDKAIGYYEQSLQTFEQVGDIHGMASTWMNLGSICLYKEERDKARNCYEESLKMFEQVGDTQGVASNHLCLGHIYLSEKEWSKARYYYEQSLQIFEQVGAIHSIALAYGSLGNVYRKQDDSENAAFYMARAYQIFSQLSAAETDQAGGDLVQILGSTEAANEYLAEMAAMENER